MDVTVAICTYNGAERLPEVFAYLAAQQAPGVTWEVLVVDNNSKDATAKVVRRRQDRGLGGPPLRYIFEPRQGKSLAIETAMREAQGTWVALLDDDNLPATDWIAALHRFARAHPQAGVFGGQIHGCFDVDLPISFGLVRSLFALNERTEEVCYSAGGRLTFAAPGAGLVVRREAWQASMPSGGLALKGPTGAGRGTLGEEFELQWRVHQHGWEIWHNPAMHLDHKIEARRFEPEYLDQFFRAIGLSRHTRRMMMLPPWKRPFATVAYWLNDLRNLVVLLWTYRGKVRRDRFVRGRAQVLVWMLARPFMGRP